MNKTLTTQPKDWREKISDCCKSKMTIKGDTTHYYSCNNCGKPCDVSPNWNPTTKGEPERDWQEDFVDKVYKYVGNMLGNYGRPLYELTELQRSILEQDCLRLSRSIIKEISGDFIQQKIKDAVEAERARLESLIPEKRRSRHDGHEIDDYYCIQCGTGVKTHPEHIYGFNEAIDIMKEAVKGNERTKN